VPRLDDDAIVRTHHLGTIGDMDLYGQEPEVLLLRSLLSRLDNRTVIDVGAERGSFVEQMIDGGADEVHAIEPEPDNAANLRERFRDVPAVIVHEYAVSDADASLQLRRSSAPTGDAVTFGHTLLERPDTDEIAWRDTIQVSGRSLASLVASGELPARAGILKIDTEGHDFAVIDGMGDLDPDVVMVEHWTDLPHSLGRCPWTGEEMISALERRGFSQYAFVAHRGEFTVLQWNDVAVPDGHMGNVVFLHDRVAGHLLPDFLACASQLAATAVGVGEMYAGVAAERLALIERLEKECVLRLKAFEDLAASVAEQNATLGN
jgi:FkbM family methyltransferase